eukprot:TRINITY_DN18358_c0_g1_i1.p1 TRINITY_DN18358_c0_g1~~TRINITY_DN18358_c0_g1_i1.p1  ORF type:complete len:537 (+),score=169.78 TRINITY_DN18358_c0_g1_i1:96-1613(+)
MAAQAALLGALAFSAAVWAWLWWTRRSLKARREAEESSRSSGAPPLRIGFFHPYSNGGGGGERVLWTMLAAVQRTYVDADITLYTHFTDAKLQEATEPELRDLVKRKFGITLLPNTTLHLVHLQGISWVEADSYPRLTLLLQSLGAVPLGYEAVSKRQVDIFIDTMGYAFTYPLVRALLPGASIVSYTHYPTVSTDMLGAVMSGRAAHNNTSAIASSGVLTHLKVVYYKAFSVMYGWAGRHCDATMVNSTWTRGHIHEIWQVPTPDGRSTLHKVYPPCDCTQMRAMGRAGAFAGSLEDLSSGGGGASVSLISVAQFRPEKDHPLQLRALKRMLDALERKGVHGAPVVLHLVGGVRNSADRQRVQGLQELAETLGITGNVKFHVDLPYDSLKQLLSESIAGLHTMWNEHFGIGIVEYMASGCIPVAHRSGGPLADIVEDGTSGFLAETEEEYADALLQVVEMSPAARSAMSDKARARSALFTEEVFNDAALAVVRGVVQRRKAAVK